MARKRLTKPSKASPQGEAVVEEGRPESARPRRRRPTARERAENRIRDWIRNPAAARARHEHRNLDLKLPNGVIDGLSGSV